MSAPHGKSSRLSFQEYMQLVPLPDQRQPNGNAFGGQNPQHQQKRYMSQRASWMPGIDLPSPMREQMTFKGAAYGGHVYSQSGLAASKAFAEMREKMGQREKGKVYGIHTIHGYFSEVGLIDRPFIYEVTPVSTANLAFANFSVTARQPESPTSSASGDYYPLSDAVNSPLGPICFTALVSFRPASVSQVAAQEDPPQKRFASILRSRKPSDWDPAPLVDIDRVVAMLPPGKKQGSGTFPCVDMKKVDMRAFNEGKPLHQRRELILYRRIISPAEKERKRKMSRRAEGEKEEPDAHILTHAFEADRNGLLMCGNHVGFGSSLARAATLSYSFVVHVSPEEAIMRTPRRRWRPHPLLSTSSHKTKDERGGGHEQGHRFKKDYEYDDEDDSSDDDEDDYHDGEWWIQEATFPRVEANRAVVLSKIWSPRGKHVATEYQDGIIKSTVSRVPQQGDIWSKL